MTIRELAAQAHKDELVRKQELTGAIAFPAGIITALIAGLVAGLLTLSWPFDVWEWATASLAFCSALAIAASCLSLCQALVAHRYRYPANIRDISTWYRSVLASGYSDAEADAALTGYLESEYLTSAAENTDHNDTRAAQIFRANQRMIAAVICLALAGMPLSITKISSAALKDGKPTTILDQRIVRIEEDGRQACALTAADRRQAADAGTSAGQTHPRKHESAQIPLDGSVRVYARDSSTIWSNTAGCSVLVNAQP